ncbi:MAG TPA: hypothetical protein VIG26_06175 [Methyloceanibacter sp.]
MKRIWYDPTKENHTLFRSGQASWVSASPDRVVEDTFDDLPISVNTYWGLLAFGIVDRLVELPTEYLLGPYEEGVLSPAGLKEAARILREEAEGIDEETRDAKVGSQFAPEKLEFWIHIDMPAFRDDLFELAEFIEAGSRRGFAVQLSL